MTDAPVLTLTPELVTAPPQPPQPPFGVMTLDDFIRRYDEQGPFEIIDGEIVPKMPTVFGHSKFANRFCRKINDFSLPRNLGEAFVEITFIKPEDYDENWVKGSRIPDVMFITQERLDFYERNTADANAKPLMLKPDLVIEIVSPNDSFTAVREKIKRYLADSVRLVWVIEPELKEIGIYHADGRVQWLTQPDEVLTAGEVIPGFEVTLAQLFSA